MSGVFVSKQFIHTLEIESDDWRGDGNPWLCFSVGNLEIIVKSIDKGYEITEGWTETPLARWSAEEALEHIYEHIPKLRTKK